jgi:predicted site-specific integrase-resolvase
MREKHYNATQAAKIIGISDKTIRRWLQAGKVQAKKTASGQIAISANEVERLRLETIEERAQFLPSLDITGHDQNTIKDDADRKLDQTGQELDTVGHLDMTRLEHRIAELAQEITGLRD